jgi:hypothetical protein
MRDALDFNTLETIAALLKLLLHTLKNAVKAFPSWFVTWWRFAFYGFITVGLAINALGFTEWASVFIGALGGLLFAYIVSSVHKKQMLAA